MQLVNTAAATNQMLVFTCPALARVQSNQIALLSKQQSMKRVEEIVWLGLPSTDKLISEKH